ncbi:fras1 related extracellular matrix protein [Plakobranchus ocellatus]|uniref:Fras1 related extracellular matrix protein n=1 Tax=Plakobranchus ocellatus TaxID=259542 RepID=A0AAV3ZHA9_9GAST|nr:fras1 related extracellular matrix protein [Plakobranchus ocellatus]
MDSLTKFTYYIGIKESNVTGEFITKEYDNFAFFGPNSPSASDKDERLLPVQFTAPYFDCGGSNKWVISAVSPVIDFMPRYSNFTHLRRQRIVGVAVMDIDLMEVDFNACNVGTGNPGPSYLSGIHKCRKSTVCKHAAGFGLRRGGYNCVCGGGKQHPFFLERPYRGVNIEQSTEEEYYNGFICTPSDYRLVLPVVDQLSGVKIEGGGEGNGGGLPPDLQQLDARKKREALNTSAIMEPATTKIRALVNSTHKGHNLYTPESHSLGSNNNERSERHPDNVKVMSADPPTDSANEAPREPSPQEIMALAEKIRDLRESNKLHKYLKLQGSRYQLDITASQAASEYADSNNVDYTVEREYEADLKQHEEYKNFLIQTDKASSKRNASRVARLLREDVLQMRERHEQRFHANRYSAGARSRRKRASVYDNLAFDKMMRILRWKSSVSRSNCHQMPNHRLTMPGDVGYGASRQFDNEGHTAVRLSNFLSMYLQNVMPDENFGNLRGGGPLHKDMMFGEVIANVMGNYRIYAAGVFFDR